MIRRALISVSDKRGVVELAQLLSGLGVEILSTGGTAAALSAAGIAVTQVSAHTGAPEILDGRVKTLHPKIHGGLLGRDTGAHREEMAAHGIAPIDLLVVNLYPFEQTIAREGCSLEDAIENIDIGGPAMLRSAAKNHERVAVVVDPGDYGWVGEALRGGGLSSAQRLALARTAFAHTAGYDAAIAAYLSAIDSALPPGVLRAPAEPGLAIDSALPPGVLRAPAEPGLAIDSALPPGVLRAPAEPGLAIDSALPPGVLRAPAEPGLAIDSALPPGVLRAPAEPGLAIDSALPPGVLRTPAEPGLAIDDAAAASPEAAPVRRELPDTLTLQWRRLYELRYGENPHQKAAFYADLRSPLAATRSFRPTIATAEVLGGKQLSYNNILDLDAALGLVLEFAEPAAVVVKHNNPSGVAIDRDIAPAYRRARDADALSAFGSVVAVNRAVDEPLARLIVETFVECVVAPGYSAAARDILAAKKNLRLVAAPGSWQPPTGELAWSVRTVAGGALVESVDHGMVALATAKVATVREPTLSERDDLAFSWRVAKHVKSNAIVFARDGATIAIGAGQMSRVDSVRICERKAGDKLEGAVVASDAYFPFRDGVDVIAEAGAVAIVQPGGSIRDDEVIAAANEHGIAMLFTGMRHFRH